MYNIYSEYAGDKLYLHEKDKIEEYSISLKSQKKERSTCKTLSGLPFPSLPMGIGLAAVESECLYRHIGYACMSEYIEKLCEDGRMDINTAYHWLYIGETYLKHLKDLRYINFAENDGPEKLLYLEEALKNNNKYNVFNKLKNLTIDEFIAFANASSNNITIRRTFRSYRDRRFLQKANITYNRYDSTNLNPSDQETS